ncbi:bifunctional helix-turn-helix transcriptional regulator/GNAT family N-acetyltransferase [Piscinibacter sp.]|jgi:DNA-binding MarR family transcriptional regulator/GNAT superfamily N-acetyltransferase|uniref:bifunctional helix-turn-helix transcriptional regulator/GNAT family N-acetyltransferase n=1 Tax=Piscinibacter sp. TaxID=1903157 RepID=UPI002F42B8F8
MLQADLPRSDRVERLRAFNRFYTRRIGVLHEGLLHTPFTLTESRLLWELAHRGTCTATELARALDLDAGYLSRLLRGLDQRGLLKSTRSSDDARQVNLSLSAAGRRAFAPLNTRSQQQVLALLDTLPEPQQQQLLQAFGLVQRLLDDAPAKDGEPAWRLRPHRAGDIGWLISRHGALYAQEYGWDMHFESLVARIAADFIDRFDAEREACWIAERDGVNVGCVLLVQSRDDRTQNVLPGVAQLRLLLVEPSARGLGIGERLVGECTRFARQAGYQRIRLWTNSVLGAARGIYQKAGYTLVASEPHHSFGCDLVGETWELPLA